MDSRSTPSWAKVDLEQPPPRILGLVLGLVIIDSSTSKPAITFSYQWATAESVVLEHARAELTGLAAGSCLPPRSILAGLC
jgi:hypothetical protein